jgi:hypothetical protein
MHTNDGFYPFPLPPLTTHQNEQQPSGNMDDSGFFSIQVSAHMHVLRASVSQALCKLSLWLMWNIFSQSWIAAVMM